MTTQTAVDRDLVDVDMTEFNRWIGVPFGGKQVKEPFVLGDFRRWATRTENHNPVHWDDEWAAASRFGRIVAPQSFQAIRDLGESTFRISKQPLSPYHSADEYYFYGPRVVAGDIFRLDRVLSTARATKTRYGPSVFATVDITYFTERGPVLKKKATTMFAPIENMKKLGDQIITGMSEEEPEWSDEALKKIDDEKYAYVKTIRTHEKRLFGSVKVGDRLPRAVIGPHSGVSIAYTEGCDLEDAHGMLHIPPDQPPALPPGVSGPPVDPERLKIYPTPRSWSFRFAMNRGHVFNSFAKTRGMPRAFHVGTTEGIWSVDYLASWAGEWGFLRRSTIRFNLPVLSGDVTYLEGEVTKLTPGPAGFGTVHVSYSFQDQLGQRVCTGIGEIELPVA